MRLTLQSILCFLSIVFWATNALALSSDSYDNPAVAARFISAENGVTPGAKTLSIGLDIQLGEGWKAYWRSPGEVGFPPKVDWSLSQNLSSADIFWPAPERFTAFGIENFGYRDRVVLPIQIVLDEAGAATSLHGRVSLLTCSEICVPHDFELTLSVPTGAGIDSQSADLITEFALKIPSTPAESEIQVTSATLTDDALVITAQSDAGFSMPDVFPEMGIFFTFGKPDIRVSASGKNLWAKLPLLARDETIVPVQVTITDGVRAVTAAPEWSATAPAPPFQPTIQLPRFMEILWIAAFAFIGGVILNAMPCVLPVLSIKLSSVLNHRDRTLSTIRQSFLMSAFGVLVFMWVLAAGVLFLQAAGVRVGWGLQFQSPVFLAIMFMVLATFTANLLGLFEITLPAALQTRVARSGGKEGHIGDFASGAFAAALATPCSAPFLGTAIAFALTGRLIDVLIVFTSLGLGLALPYILLALQPAWVGHLPKPGRWMLTIKWGLAGLLGLTALWLFWILIGVAGTWVASVVLALSIVLVLFATLPRLGSLMRSVAVSGTVTAAIAVTLTQMPTPVSSSLNTTNWVVFERSAIPRLVSEGKTVFVDVTADWCLTCKANKALVLDRDPVVSILETENVVAMQADWTRPDPAIARYLESKNRFGIPFNMVYGPNAPDGILLSEILSSSSVIEALNQATLK